MATRLIYGVGLYEKGQYGTRDGRKMTLEYEKWMRMLQRCYDVNYTANRQTYAGCTVSEKFLNFQSFAGWCHSQQGFGLQGYQLDKDYLGTGKLYGPEICVFVPRELNVFLIDSRASRGAYPVGVDFHKASGKFRARLSKGKPVDLGLYKTEEDAFAAYKQAKEAYARELADKWEGKVDSRVIEKLRNWEVPTN